MTGKINSSSTLNVFPYLAATNVKTALVIGNCWALCLRHEKADLLGRKVKFRSTRGLVSPMLIVIY